MTTKELANMLADDKDAVAKFDGCTSLEDAYAIAKELGLTDSFEEFQAAGKMYPASSEALSEEDLAAVAGGSSCSAMDGGCVIC